MGKIEQHQLKREKMPVVSDVSVWFILDKKIAGSFILLEKLSNNLFFSFKVQIALELTNCKTDSVFQK